VLRRLPNFLLLISILLVIPNLKKALKKNKTILTGAGLIIITISCILPTKISLFLTPLTPL